MTTLRVNVHEVYAVATDPEDPEAALASPLDGPLQLVWDSEVPEEIVLRFADGEYSLARSQFFTYEMFPEAAASAVMNVTEDRMLFRTPADEPGYTHLTMSERGPEIRTWVFNTYAQEAANPPSRTTDEELARLLEGTL